MKKEALVCLFLFSGLGLVYPQKFWSPREIVLDSYEDPISFRIGGEWCIAYELHVTNMDSYLISVKRIEVLAGGGTLPTKPIRESL